MSHSEPRANETALPLGDTVASRAGDKPRKTNVAAIANVHNVEGLVDVHAHFTTPSYITKAKAAGHREADGMPESSWPQ